MTELVCDACGEANPARARFCLACGTALKGPAAAETDNRQTRKTVTVVFSDLAGFTTLSETLDPESLRGVMDSFYARMRTAVEGERGTIAKFIGDAVLAVWGAREIEEDDAVRAVRAAEAMRTALAGLNEELEARWGVAVAMRTGVNTGEVVVDPSQGVDLLVGDTLNVAARLEQAAGAGEVLIGPETARLVRDHVTLAPGDPLALKGKAEPVPVCRLVDGTMPCYDAPPRADAPFVGRDEQLARLEAALTEAEATGRTRLATVVGAPGVGKSRLVAEFVRAAGARARVLHGRCERAGEGATLLPIAQVVRAAAAIAEDDTADTVAAKLDAVLPTDLSDRERVGAVAASVLGTGDVTAAAGEELFWGIRRLFEALATERPVVVVVDDIHWAQATLLDLLEHLGEWGRDGPVLVVALARPELRDTRPALTVAGEHVSAALALEPLDEAASATLVDELLGTAGLSTPLSRRILDTTEGNPLFLSEMVRMLVDDGVLTPGGDDRPVGELAAAQVVVPPTIHALLGARLERLGREERVVVERASVVGHQFWRGAVAELAPEPLRAGLDGHLAGLGRKELVARDGVAFGDEPTFRFHHALIRDAAYRTLLKQVRAELHEQVADWLEHRASGQDEVVGFHFEQAHAYLAELGPLDGAGLALAARGAAHLHLAGARALAREDLPAARNLLARAVGLLPADDPQRPPLLVALAEALLSAGDTAAAREVVDALAEGAAPHERQAAWAVAFAGQLANLQGAGGLAETLAATEAAALRLRELGDGPGEAKAWQVAAQAQALVGRVGAAETALDRALVAARAAGDERRVRSVLASAPRAALWGPSAVVRASGRCLDVVRILRMTPGSRHLEVAAQQCTAVLEAMRGRADAARGILATARATLEELGLALPLAELDTSAGLVELLAGEPVAAEALFVRARDGLDALGVVGGAGQAAAHLARALLEQDRLDEAEAATRLAERRGGEDLKTAIAWRGVRAEVLARRGEHAAASLLAEEAVALAEPTDALADRGDALLSLAHVRHLAGDGEGAGECAARAAGTYAEKGHLVGAERAGALAPSRVREPDASEVTGPAGRPADSLAEAHTARFCALFNGRDWDGLRELYAPGLTGADHRPLGWAHLDRDGLLAMLRGFAELAPDSWGEPGPVLADAGDVFARVLLGYGTGPDGARFEMPMAHLIRITEGLEDRLEVFDPDDLGGILRRFEELRAERAAGAVVAVDRGESFATGDEARMRARLDEVTAAPAPPDAFAALTQDVARAFNARDWDTYRSLFAEGYLAEDHRAVGWPPIDRDVELGQMQELTAVAPDARVVIDPPLAAGHGVGVVVTRGSGTGPDGGRIEMDGGQVMAHHDAAIERSETFEPEDEVGMLRRYAELHAERARHPAERVLAEHWHAFNQRDWTTVAASFPATATVVDHRRLGAAPTRDGAGSLAFLRSWVDLVPDATGAVTRVVATRPNAALVVVRGLGHGPDGGSFTVEVCTLAIVADGHIEHTEQFEVGAVAATLARLDELGPHTERG